MSIVIPNAIHIYAASGITYNDMGQINIEERCYKSTTDIQTTWTGKKNVYIGRYTQLPLDIV